MLTKEQIKIGIDRNLMVFDQYGESGILTYRLAGLLIDICLLNFQQKLTEIYVPAIIKIDVELDDKNKRDPMGIYDVPYVTMAGLYVHKIYELLPEHELYQYYFKELKGNLASSHNHLVVATGPEDNVILGSIK
jgi:hypothetical protein